MAIRCPGPGDAKAVVSSGPDYVSLTSVEAENSADLFKVAGLYWDSLEPNQVEIKPWRFQGYAGYTGGGVRSGLRNDNEAILIVSGEGPQAALYALDMPAFRVTRFDIQVTLLLRTPHPLAATELYSRLQEGNAHLKRKRYYNLIRSTDGDTLYVNKRGQTRLLRFYDKSSAYGEDKKGSVWRYEVEYRREAARTAYAQFCKAKTPEHWIVGQVAAEYARRGIIPAFKVGTIQSAIEVKAKASGPEAKLSWLTKCVAPVVAQLLHLGYEYEVLHALNLRGAVNLHRRPNGSE